MKRRILAPAVLMTLVATLAPAGAEQRFGVKVYADATYDGETSQWVSNNMKVDAACYRTAADPINVNMFYEKMFGVTEVRKTNHTGLFKKGDINITVQNPWTDVRTGQEHKDTLISIVKTK